jgi:hypothetical protein
MEVITLRPPYPRQKPIVLIEYEAAWAPKPIRTFWRKEIVSPPGNRTLEHPITRPITLCLLLKGKFDPVHAMKGYSGSRNRDPLVRNLGIR